ncbi:MAG: hypothetical protein RBS56_01710 [Candidatus Gracilibacteria bacterium]|jgi:hypothetical protein|nr:hypothetical protein [Candidatus Gracilibacteria bacterium]
MKKLLVLATTSILMLLIVNNAFATSSPAFSFIKNSNTGFTYTTTPGSTIKDYLTITNQDQERWLEISISTNKIPERWARFDSYKIRLKPLETIKTPFSITIPENSEEKTIKGLIIGNLSKYEQTNSSSNGGIKVSLGIGNELSISIINGEKLDQDYTKGIITNKISNISKENKQTEINKTFQENISLLYIQIEENINKILLLIIIALILKIALTKTHKPAKKIVKKPTKKIIKKTKKK